MTDFASLAKTACLIRQDIVKMIAKAGSGHPAGSLGIADIMTALYFAIAKINPKKPRWFERDRVVLSHGHVCPALYAALARRGFFPLSKLPTLRKFGSPMQGHPHFGELPGIENSSGPLGQGISQAIGMALAGKMDKKNYHVFCLMSDGELNEGQSWEAFLLAAKYHLDNLIVIIDRNQIQLSGQTENILPLEPLKEKLADFNFRAEEINGHDFPSIVRALENGKNYSQGPTAIIAKTTPGKGVSFMENDWHWHGQAPNEAEARRALKELL